MIKSAHSLSTKILKMVNVEKLIERDLRHVWHPCSQMKDFETCPPFVIESAKGSYLYTDHGPLIDGISSWWCKSLGHGHPAVLSAIKNQLKYFEHVIGANTTHPLLVDLAEELAEVTGKQHVFFASDGASAVEIAMKLTIHAQQIKGFKNKNEFIALKNGYHGESLGTMSISDLGIYKAPYQNLGVNCHFIEDIPYLCDINDPLWDDCSSHWDHIVKKLDELSGSVCAVIFEPIVQGAGGMLCYSADFLHKLAAWAKAKDIYIIADEIMTGIGRTGKWLASDHAQISPDLICLSKGLTSGSIPMSCVMIDNTIFDLFYADYYSGKSFLHSNTYSCNPLAIAAALATIKTIRDEQVIDYSLELGQHMRQQMQDIARQTGKLNHVRGIGAIVAADLTGTNHQRIGNLIYQEALKHGALIRPIGKTLYWLPPLNTEKEIIGKLAEITLNSIETAYIKAKGHE